MTKSTPLEAFAIGVLKTLSCCFLAAALILLSPAAETFAAAKADKPQSQQTSKAQGAKKTGLRAQPWAFGGGKSARTWANRGVDGSTLQKNAIAQQKNAAAPASGSEKDKDASASSGKKGLKSLLDGDGFTVSVDEERRGWEVSPSRTLRAGEDKASDSQHRVRAFATHHDDNLSIGLGPEFIVKDTNDTNTLFSKNHDQPELDAGVGMQFKLDF